MTLRKAILGFSFQRVGGVRCSTSFTASPTPSGRATLATVARAHVWPGMRRDILRWARECLACQVSKVAIHTKPLVVPIPIPKSRFDHVHVDLVGPFSPDRGYRYILTIVDGTTRWPEAVPHRGHHLRVGAPGL